ncbi:Hypothetical_protein [Hexamita inflata]|uniref:Hypothetical_protein n=1 Tax=Hexamita inflata TaxID=28002 RepID=A0AA86UMU4_9EUKA|nr:Hypothetical protein HINF_LOCUS49124 [Hexamita inflata]
MKNKAKVFIQASKKLIDGEVNVQTFESMSGTFKELIAMIFTDQFEINTDISHLNPLVWNNYHLLFVANQMISIQNSQIIEKTRQEMGIHNFEEDYPSNKQNQIMVSNTTFANFLPNKLMMAVKDGKFQDYDILDEDLRTALKLYLIAALLIVSNKFFAPAQKQLAMQKLQLIFLTRSDSVFIIRELFKRNMDKVEIPNNTLDYFLISAIMSDGTELPDKLQLLRILSHVLVVKPALALSTKESQSFTDCKIPLDCDEYLLFVIQCLQNQVPDKEFFGLKPSFHQQMLSFITKYIPGAEFGLDLNQLNVNFLWITYLLLAAEKDKVDFAKATALVKQLLAVSFPAVEKLSKQISQVYISAVASVFNVLSSTIIINFKAELFTEFLNSLQNDINGLKLLRSLAEQTIVYSTQQFISQGGVMLNRFISKISVQDPVVKLHFGQSIYQYTEKCRTYQCRCDRTVKQTFLASVEPICLHQMVEIAQGLTQIEVLSNKVVNKAEKQIEIFSQCELLHLSIQYNLAEDAQIILEQALNSSGRLEAVEYYLSEKRVKECQRTFDQIINAGCADILLNYLCKQIVDGDPDPYVYASAIINDENFDQTNPQIYKGLYDVPPRLVVANCIQKFPVVNESALIYFTAWSYLSNEEVIAIVDQFIKQSSPEEIQTIINKVMSISKKFIPFIHFLSFKMNITIKQMSMDIKIIERLQNINPHVLLQIMANNNYDNTEIFTQLIKNKPFSPKLVEKIYGLFNDKYYQGIMQDFGKAFCQTYTPNDTETRFYLKQGSKRDFLIDTNQFDTIKLKIDITQLDLVGTLLIFKIVSKRKDFSIKMSRQNQYKLIISDKHEVLLDNKDEQSLVMTLIKDQVFIQVNEELVYSEDYDFDFFNPDTTIQLMDCQQMALTIKDFTIDVSAGEIDTRYFSIFDNNSRLYYYQVIENTFKIATKISQQNFFKILDIEQLEETILKYVSDEDTKKEKCLIWICVLIAITTETQTKDIIKLWNPTTIDVNKLDVPEVAKYVNNLIKKVQNKGIAAVAKYLTKYCRLKFPTISSDIFLDVADADQAKMMEMMQ